MIKKFYLTHRVTLTNITTPGQSGSESNGNEGVLRIYQELKYPSFTIRCSLVTCLGHSLAVGVSNTSGEM